MAKIIAVANQKGGCGKTTTTICFAQELRGRKKKVLVIDTDPQCNTTDFYQAEVEDQNTVADILYGDVPAADCIQHKQYGDIIPSDKELSNAESMTRPDEMRFLHLKKSLKGIKDQYDYIIIDTPPAIGVLLKNVLATADEILIPIEESGWSVKGLMDLNDAVTMAENTTNENLHIAGLLVIKAKKNTRRSRRIEETSEMLAEKMNTRLFHTKIRESVRTSEALTEYGIPLWEYAPGSTTQLDYEDFVNEFLKDERKRAKAQ